ncbi:LPS biosynthesis protein [Lachnospiraceae bacterium JC7]|nr:LPS biosynthesis protein [Lachnospiraceae bacterium JC7]
MIQLGEDFYREEIKCGFKVTSKRKRCWAVLLNMLKEFDAFAKKYSLKYYVGYGTLLGAVRHKGFIPWDDDVDVVMLRDEYMKMSKFAREYFSGRVINGRRIVFEDAYSVNTVKKTYFSKLRDYETTMAEQYMIRHGKFAGISVDIFPIDAMYDGTDEMLRNTLIRSELWLSWVHGIEGFEELKKVLQGPSVLGDELLRKICSMSSDERMRLFENHALSMWGKSKKVGDYIENIKYMGRRDSELSSWENTCLLQFENLMVPAPAGWDEILHAEYGDYNEYVMGGSEHENSYYDPDTPFQEYIDERKCLPHDWNGLL